MTQQQDCIYDVVIAGGGMVGASLAVALAGLDLKLALVEAVPVGQVDQPSFDDRTIALSRGSQRILSSLGIWDAIAPHSWPIHQIHVSERGRFGTAVIDGQEQGVGDLGHLVTARTVGQILWQRIEQIGTIDVFCPGRIEAAESADDAVTATVNTGDEMTKLSTKLIAVADGARSNLRKQLGVTASIVPYGQTAIVGNVGVDSSRAGHVAFERFTPDGPMALLPGRDATYTFVLTRSEDTAPGVMDMNDDEFRALLQKTFGYRLGQFQRLAKRHAYPLHLVTAERIATKRAAIIGNAAHGLHPVAGQGFNLGLRDVSTLAEIIADDARSAEATGDAGNSAILDRYSAWRRRDQRNVVAFTDGLIRLFDIPLETAGVARGLSLLAVDLLPGAKRALAHHTMGLGGKLTRLARGLRL